MLARLLLFPLLPSPETIKLPTSCYVPVLIGAPLKVLGGRPAAAARLAPCVPGVFDVHIPQSSMQLAGSVVPRDWSSPERETQLLSSLDLGVGFENRES